MTPERMASQMTDLLAGKKRRGKFKPGAGPPPKVPKAAQADRGGAGGRAAGAWPSAPPMPTREGFFVEYMGAKITAKPGQNKFRIYIPATRTGRGKALDLDRMFNDDKKAAYLGCVRKIQDEVSQ